MDYVVMKCIICDYRIEAILTLHQLVIVSEAALKQ